MNKNVLIALLVIIIALLAYFGFKTKNDIDKAIAPISQEESIKIPNTTSTPTSEDVPTLSGDKKSILSGDKTLLSIDDDAIFNFFKDPKNGMCDENNKNNTTTRESFCTSKVSFKTSATFSKIITSSTTSAVGFVIETNELTPDTTSGIFFPKNTTYKVHLLTNYYLGNDFLSFSPSGTRFVYKEGCFEGICGFTIKETSTLKTVQHFGNPETGPSNVFTRWISDTRIEYSTGAETKQVNL